MVDGFPTKLVTQKPQLKPPYNSIEIRNFIGLRMFKGNICRRQRTCWTCLFMENSSTHQPMTLRNQYLVWAHMQRRHELMSVELKNDLNELLRHSMKVSQAMIEVACMRVPW